MFVIDLSTVISSTGINQIYEKVVFYEMIAFILEAGLWSQSNVANWNFSEACYKYGFGFYHCIWYLIEMPFVPLH